MPVLAGGLVLALVGVAGLFADTVVAIDAPAAQYVTGASVILIVAGCVLAAVGAYGRWGSDATLVPVVGVIVALVSEWIFSWMPTGLRPWALGALVVLAVVLGLGLLVAIGVGITDEYGPMGFGGCTAFVGLGALIADAFVDLGAGWDPSLNVLGTLLLTGGLATLVLGDGSVDIDDVLDDDERLLGALGGAGAAAALTALVAAGSFVVPTWAWFLLAAVVVIGLGLALPIIGYGVIYAYFGERRDDVLGNNDVVVSAGIGTVLATVGSYAVLMVSTEDLWVWLGVVFVLVAVLAYGGTLACLIGVSHLVLVAPDTPPRPASVDKPEPESGPVPAGAAHLGPGTPPRPPSESTMIADTLVRLTTNADRVYRLLPYEHPAK